MSDSEWKQDFEDRVIALLRSSKFDLKTPHHFGQPFVSAYQLAVAFEARHPEICQQYSKGVGNQYHGMSNLAAYFARQLSQGIKADPEHYPVEGAWLAGQGLADLHFRHGNEITTGTPNSEYGAFSLYRIKK